jgi:uncharacterized protein YjbI with pentapeptide repeats
MSETDTISNEVVDAAEWIGACLPALEWLSEEPRTWGELVEKRTSWAQWGYRSGLIPPEVADTWRTSADPLRRIAAWRYGDPPLDLSGAKLAGAHLQGADLEGADLRDANLRGANLQGAELAGANLRGADLVGAHLEGADMEGVKTQGENMTENNLIGAEVICKAERIEACYADLQWLRGQPRTWAELAEQRTGAAQWGAKRGLVPTEIADAWRSSADPRRRIAAWRSWDQPLDLSGANLQGVNLQGAELGIANLSGANLQGANLQFTKLHVVSNRRKAGLTDADPKCANLSGADLRGANLRCADLEGADLRDANLRGADMRCANLESADLRGADLQEADIRGVYLSGSKGP